MAVDIDMAHVYVGKLTRTWMDGHVWGEQLYFIENLIKYVGIREEYEMNILDL